MERGILWLTLLLGLLSMISCLPYEMYRMKRYSYRNVERHEYQYTRMPRRVDRKNVGARKNSSDTSITDRVDRRFGNGEIKIVNNEDTTRDSLHNNYPIVFPGDLDKYRNPCGIGKTFCDDATGYPTEQIRDLLLNSARQFDDILGIDTIDVEISQRFDFDTDATLCLSTEEVVYPKQFYSNKENKWLYIVNQEQYKQGIRVEKCVDENSPCQFAKNFPNGYEVTCKQKYINRKLLAFDKEDSSTVVDLFKIPSCCSCLVRSRGDIASRMGFSDTTEVPKKKNR